MQGKYELEEHESALLTEMCRVADRLDALARVVDAEGVIEEGTGRAHPALVESRQLGIAYARLSAALRLQAGAEGDHQAGRGGPAPCGCPRGVPEEGAVRVREARQASLPAPPEELLWFGNRTCSGPGPGMGAYPDRAAWLAARRDWETRHGMTVAEWSAATLAELQRRAGSMTELNEALKLTMYEPDDWHDPRLSA